MNRKKLTFLIAIILIISLFFILKQKRSTDKASSEYGNLKYELYCGSGKMGYKDGERLEAQFIFNYGMALNKENDLIVVDSYNNIIRKVSEENILTLVGSSNKKDNFGLPLGEYVDGDVDKSKFNKPRDILLDDEDNAYISDSGNNIIRKVSDGIVYTFSGTGKKGYKDGKIKESEFNLPSGIAMDENGNIYIADTLNHVIRKISKNGQVSTFAGVRSEIGGLKDGSLNESMFNEPSDIVIDNNGIMYISDSGNQRIRKIENDKVTTIAGCEHEYINGTSYVKGGFVDGKSSESKFNFPKGLCLDDKGNIYVADTFNHRIRIIKTDGSVETLLGDGKAGDYNKNRLNQPVAVVYNEGCLYISDSKNNIIGKLKIK